jgi:hypothetical protein
MLYLSMAALLLDAQEGLRVLDNVLIAMELK